jgi:putative ABC transport system permease protein
MLIQNFLQDLRLGLRVLIKEKSFCALAVFVLALGICAVTTQFSVVNGVILRGFSFPNAARLMSINFIDPTQTTAFGTNGQLSAMDYQELLPVQKSFELLASQINGATVNVTIGSVPKRFTGAYITENWLRILGVVPLLGRDLTAADNQPGSEKVALIGYNLWQREFAGSANIIGTGVRVNGKPATIIGVMPKGFSFPTNEELWIPLHSEFPALPRNNPRAIGGAVVGLLRPDVSLDQASLEIDAIAKRFARAYPDTNKQFNTGQVQPLRQTFTPSFLKNLMFGMLAICFLVLLIACLNVMNMQFARAALRGKELAVRSSLGATRGRLIRQMLTESILLASLGAIIGVAGSYWAVDFLTAVTRNLPFPPPAWITFEIDGVALLFTVMAAMAAAIFSGLVPAWMSSRANASNALKEGGRGNTSRTVNFITRSLVIAQIVLTSIILVASLLLARSMQAQQELNYGYDKEGVLTARMGLMDGDYPTQQDRLNFYQRLLVQLRGNPQFDSAALTSRFRMTFVFNGPGAIPIEIEGRTYKDNKDRPNTNLEQISEGYHESLGVRILEGRDFKADDSDQKLPVAIVNAAFAKKHFPKESAVGRRFRTVANNGVLFGPWRTIVGVAPDLRMAGPFNNPNVDDTGFYLPIAAAITGPTPDQPAVSQFATVIVRPRGGQRAAALADALRREAAKVDGNLPLYFIETPADGQNSFIAQNRIIAIMVGLFGVVAVILASVGLYGVMSFSVNQRTQEFGVRMALGADAKRILGMVLRQGAWQTGLGLTVGLGLAFLLGTLGRAQLQAIFFNTSPTDPLTYAAVAGLLILVSLVAAFIPAKRATRINPLDALRAE